MSKLYPFQSRRPYAARLTDKKHVPYLTEAGTLTAYGVPAFATRWGRQTSAYSAPKDAYILPSGIWCETADHVPTRAGEHGAEYDGAPAAGHAWRAIADAWLRDRHADETARRGDVPAAAVHVVEGRVVEVREGSPEGRALATWEDGAEAIADLLRLPYLQPEPWEAAPLPGPAPLKSGYERLGRRPVDWAA